MEEMPEKQPQERTEEEPKASFLEKFKIHKFLSAGRQGKILAGILGVFVLAGAVFGVYKLGQRQVQPALQPTPTPVVTPLPTPAPDPTADWKTYTNTEYGYSIKYPNEVNLDESYGYIVFGLWGPTQKAETEFYDGISLRFRLGSLEGKTLKEFVDEKVSQSEEVGEILISPTATTIAGVTGYTYRSRGLGEHTYFYVSPKPGVYIEIINSTADPTDQGFQETVDLMLSTFRFISEESVGEKVFCEDPRPQVCTMECIVNPPYICGSDRKSYCTGCSACLDPKVEWYVIQSAPCGIR